MRPPQARWSTFFFFNDTATTEIYTLSLHDALPISPDLVFAREVGVLPQADVKAHLPEVRDHAARVRKARGGELVVALPVGLEPAGIQVDHVARDQVATQLRRDVAHLRFRLVRDPAHPQAERPERRDWAAPPPRPVLPEHRPRLTPEDEQGEHLLPPVDDGVLIAIIAQ